MTPLSPAFFVIARSETTKQSLSFVSTSPPVFLRNDPFPLYPPSRRVIARSEATKQSLLAIALDCFASLAMTHQAEGEEIERGASAPLEHLPY